MKQPVFFVIFSSGNGEFLSYEELNLNLSFATIESHISIFLNPLLNQILPKQITWNFPIERSMTKTQAEVFDLMNEEDFDYLQILKKKNEISGAKVIKHFPGSVKEHDLKQGYEAVTIENYHDKGRVTSR